jgi:hypothetical protein
MQQRADSFRFVCAIFHRDRRDAQYMRDKGNSRLFAKFSPVNPRSVSQRFFELRRELHSLYFGSATKREGIVVGNR